MKKAITILTLIIAIASCKKEVSDEFHAYTGQQLNDTVWVTTGAYSAICDTISNTLNTIPFYVDSFAVVLSKHLQLYVASNLRMNLQI